MAARHQEKPREDPAEGAPEIVDRELRRDAGHQRKEDDATRREVRDGKAEERQER